MKIEKNARGHKCVVQSYTDSMQTTIRKEVTKLYGRIGHGGSWDSWREVLTGLSNKDHLRFVNPSGIWTPGEELDCEACDHKLLCLLNPKVKVVYRREQ